VLHFPKNKEHGPDPLKPPSPRIGATLFQSCDEIAALSDRRTVAQGRRLKAGLIRRRCRPTTRAASRRAKTDQEGHGAKIAIVRGSVACPVEALKLWRDAGGISEGAVFRPIRKGGRVQDERLSDRSVANIVKAHAARVGLDPSSFSGHSLRAGFLTSAAKRGANLFKMMETSRHKSVDTLRGYVRDAELFRDHAGAELL